jgi:DNA-binding transcriptional regulator LsrR (DeoR family)
VPAPVTSDPNALAKSVGLALGQFLSEAIPDNYTIGVGWGRTMTASLSSFRPPRRDNCKVVSLLGGIVAVHQTNPIDYTWRLASQLGAECYMFLAPLLVDSTETKRNLIEKCGLDTIYRLAETLDLAIVSCGDIGPHSTSLSEGWISKAELQQLIDAGCVCDTMFNFLDKDGNTVDHSINSRVMSVDLAEEGQAHRALLRRRPPGGCHQRHHQADRLQHADNRRERRPRPDRAFGRRLTKADIDLVRGQTVIRQRRVRV